MVKFSIYSVNRHVFVMPRNWLIDHKGREKKGQYNDQKPRDTAFDLDIFLGCLKDVLLLVDESSGMLHYRHDILDFLAHLVDHFDVSQHGTHVSLATYSTTVHQQFALDSYYNDNDMEHAIKVIHFRGGSSDTNVGLDYILKHAATPQAGDRLNVPDTVVIVTSSVSSSSLTYVNGKYTSL